MGRALLALALALAPAGAPCLAAVSQGSSRSGGGQGYFRAETGRTESPDFQDLRLDAGIQLGDVGTCFGPGVRLPDDAAAAAAPAEAAIERRAPGLPPAAARENFARPAPVSALPLGERDPGGGETPPSAIGQLEEAGAPAAGGNGQVEPGPAYDGGRAPRLAGAPANAIDETEGLLEQLERVRVGRGGLPAAARETPVVIVPGWNYDTFGEPYARSAQERLKRLGVVHEFVWTDPLGPAEPNIRRIETVLAKYPGLVLLVGQSRGAREARRLLASSPELAARVVALLLNTPTEGTEIMDWFDRHPLAYVAFVLAIRLLHPRALLRSNPLGWLRGMRELSASFSRTHPEIAGAGTPPGMPVFSVASRFARSIPLLWVLRKMAPALYQEENDGVVPSAKAVIPGSYYAVLDMGHAATWSDAGWAVKLIGLGGPYDGFAGDFIEAALWWIFEREAARRASAAAG